MAENKGQHTGQIPSEAFSATCSASRWDISTRPRIHFTGGAYGLWDHSLLLSFDCQSRSTAMDWEALGSALVMTRNRLPSRATSKNGAAKLGRFNWKIGWIVFTLTDPPLIFRSASIRR